MNIKCDFYKNRDKGIINPILFSEIAEQCSCKIHESGGEKANKRTQIRRFYDEVQRLNTAAKLNSDDWDNILPYVNMLIAKAVYAQGRKLVSTDFVDFLKDCISQVKLPRDLEIFANFFEAFMGYYRQYGS